MSDLSRFYGPQRRQFEDALEEIRRGFKTSHWIWFVFPQIDGLGSSATAQYYAIRSLDEARDFAADPFLGGNLRTITNALLELPGNDPHRIMGYPDDLKLRSSMTLFSLACPDEPIFNRVLEKYYNGVPDEMTLHILESRK